MKAKRLNSIQVRLLALLAVVIFFASLAFSVSHVWGSIFHERAMAEKEPAEEPGKINYYREVDSLLSRAISLSRANAAYYADRGDFFNRAMDAGLKEKLSIEDKEVESLYKTAIDLNPVDYKAHLKLAGFYMGQGSKKAEAEFRKAVALSPSDYQVYLYTSKYFLKQKDGEGSLRNLILFFHYADCDWHVGINSIRGDIERMSGFLLDEKARELRVKISSFSTEFDFKEQGFPHARIPLKVIAYLKGNPREVILYKDNLPYAYFRKVDSTPEHTVYELSLDNFLPGVHLDDFKIKTDPAATIGKVEIIKTFGQ